MRLTRRNFAKASALAATATLVPFSIEGCSTSWIVTAEQDLPTILSIVESILSIAALASGNGTASAGEVSAITSIGNTIKASLAALQAVIASYNAAPSSTLLAQIAAGLSAIQQNLSAILAAAHIANNALQTTITTAVGLALSVVASIQLLMPAPAPATVKAKLAVGVVQRPGVPVIVTSKPSIITSGQLKYAYNSVATMYGYGDHQI